MTAQRRCVACRGQVERDDGVRLTVDPAGCLVVDLRGRLPGRGAWIHPVRDCVAAVMNKPSLLGRTLRTPSLDTSALGTMLRERVVAAAMNGLSQAAAAGAIVGGADRLGASLSAREVRVVVVATDASERSVRDLRRAAPDEVPFVGLPLDRQALGVRVGTGPRAAVGVRPGRASRHLLSQLDRLRTLG